MSGCTHKIATLVFRHVLLYPLDWNVGAARVLHDQRVEKRMFRWSIMIGVVELRSDVERKLPREVSAIYIATMALHGCRWPRSWPAQVLYKGGKHVRMGTHTGSRTIVVWRTIELSNCIGCLIGVGPHSYMIPPCTVRNQGHRSKPAVS